MLAFDAARWQAGGGLTWEQTAFPSFWSNLPTFDSSPLDGFKVSERHAVYKHLIASTGGEPLWGNRCEHHWLWAYSAQLDWQQQSGRLNADRTANAIMPNSWFGIMNFCFCICVLLGAAQAGVVPTPTLTAETAELLNAPGIASCTETWAEFWAVEHSSFVEAASAAAGDDAKLDELRDDFQRKVWRAHTRTIEGGMLASEDLLNALPADERAFSLGWTRMVELLASVNWSTSLATLQKDGIGYLPSEVLQDEAVLEGMRTSAPKERAAVLASQQLGKMPLPLLKLVAAFWRRVARWRFARRRMPATLANLTYEKRRLPLSLARLVVLAALPKSVIEAAAAALALALGWLLRARAAVTLAMPL